MNDAHAPYRERVRLEENPWLTPWSGWAYRQKHAHGRWRYPSELVSHFRNDTGLDRPLSGLSRPGGKRLRVTAVGDLMWQRTAQAAYLTPSVLDHLASADLVVLNLESVVDPSRPHGQRGLVPRFTAAPQYLAPIVALARRTRVVAQVANNHCLDQGDRGLRATLQHLADVGIPSVGAALPGEEPTSLLDIAGVRVGIAAFTSLVNRPWSTWHTGLVLGRCRGLVRGRSRAIAPVLDAVRRLRERGAQLVLAGVHWGHEHELLPDPRQLAVARALAVAGADAILGHHPHLAQPLELLRVNGDRAHRRPAAQEPDATGEKLCVAAYSLGNFVSNMIRPDWSLGLLADLVFRIEGAAPAALDALTIRPLLIHPLRHKGGFGVGLLDESWDGHPASPLCAATRLWWRGLCDLSLFDGDQGKRLQGPPSRWSAVVRAEALRAAAAVSERREARNG